MATFYKYKYIDVGSISDGSTSSGSWTADEDYILQRVFPKLGD